MIGSNMVFLTADFMAIQDGSSNIYKINKRSIIIDYIWLVINQQFTFSSFFFIEATNIC